MTEHQVGVTILVAILALLGGAGAAASVNAFARRKVTRAESDHLIVESANALMLRQQEQIDRGDRERMRLEEQIANLEREVDGLRTELREERRRCDAELHELRLELRSALQRIDPSN